ncbi:hypothetical protein M378DRAFT_17777 [Amanita muscaria Koide BX008]|uniref:Uncharacterized protein n=1 Tax=Amanita muscaria (strain Koide BX008) TaxID=946122 RepID=A0A0C2W3E2_AMAMK|nr:hypothetical protein M378DRAFT_17777 [Amanita muscaria Koide BX008]
MQRHSLDLVLLKFSTGEYHPLARRPRIHVQRSPDAQPWVTPTVLGDNVALVVHSGGNTSLHQLFIFDWKSGHKRLQHETAKKGYSTPVFVSPELLFVPNLALSSFEVWHLPPSDPNATPPVQILSLQLPAVSEPFSISELSCDGGPSPFIHSIPDILPRPFFPSPENSVIIANLRVGAFRSLRSAHYYTLIISRRALLDTIQKLASPSLLEHLDLPERLMNEVTVHKFSDLDDGLVRLVAQSRLVSTKAHRKSSPQTSGSGTFATSQTSPASPISAASGSISSGSFTTSSTSQCSFLQVQWADWGPPISRWFRVAEGRGIISTSTSAGQRCALLLPRAPDRGLRRSIVSVVDFNPHNFRGSSNGNDKEGMTEEEEAELEIFDHGDRFSEEVYMGLKCVVYNAPDEYDFDAVLVDEERLLGVKHDQHYNPQSVKVLYFG